MGELFRRDVAQELIVYNIWKHQTLTFAIKESPMTCSVVIPAFNEEQNIAEIHNRLSGILASLGCEHEIIFVDDGSTDNTLKEIKELSNRDKNVKYVSFTRNFGHEAASTAGLDASTGDCVILMDADLQDPPELIPRMIEAWKNGSQLVYAKRKKRFGESFFKRTSANIFYRLLNVLSESKIPLDTGDFRLMDRCLVNDFLKCREQNRFVRGLTAWVGYKQTAIEFDRPERHAGRTKYNPIRLILLSLDVITGFSLVPLRIVIFSGFLISMISMVITITVVLQKLFFNLALPGYALLASGLFFLGGVQIFFLGVIGEYVGKIIRQTQQRPLYLVREMNTSK